MSNNKRYIMKKILVLMATLITGCTTVTIMSDNKDCIAVREFKVLQALNDGALAYECTIWDGCSSFNQLYYIENLLDKDYYDGMEVKIPSNKCAVQNGVYRYTNKQDTVKTVPSIRFEFKDNPKTEEDIQERIYDKYKRMYNACVSDFNTEKLGNGDKFCDCYAINFVKYLIDAESSEKEFSKDELNKTIKKECGKIPDFLK